MFFIPRKIATEKKTIQVMMGIYCRKMHKTHEALCSACQELLEYAHLRLERCRFGEKKTACAQCPVHCYERKKREEIIQVMRLAGPLMPLRHPLLAAFHILRKK